MKIDLAGKKALIGGSSKGIGLGIASQLAESGASVCLMARNKSKLEEIINQLPNSENHSYLIVDFSNFEEYKIVYTTSLIVPKMQKNKWGRIINVTSVSVKEPLNYLVLSNSIRSAVVAWAKSLSVDVGKDGVTVNSILTGYFDTERIKELNKEKSKSLNISEEEVLEKMKSLVPINRLGKTEEYGYLVSFLSSDKASYINGASIPIDGGLLRSY